VHEDDNPTGGEQHLHRIKQKVEELERLLSYKAQSLSEQDRQQLDADLHNSIKMRKWVE
jgi:hypothetical protein